jgi:hypothetical protein
VSTATLQDETWLKILQFLRSCPDVYVGEDKQGPALIEGLTFEHALGDKATPKN